MPANAQLPIDGAEVRPLPRSAVRGHVRRRASGRDRNMFSLELSLEERALLDALRQPGDRGAADAMRRALHYYAATSGVSAELPAQPQATEKETAA